MKAAIQRTETPLSVYRSSLAPWLALSHEGRQKVVAALELLVLQGRDVPLDGRAPIVENQTQASQQWPQGHQPMARHSRPGDVIRLVSPEEIAAFTAYRRTMALIFDDRQIGSSEREQAYEAIVEAIRLGDNQLSDRAVPGKARQFLLRLPERYPIATSAAVSVLFLIACVALGGGIFSAVSGTTATGANGGVYIINKFTGDAYWCPPGGGCRSL
jgi:hypothetical protein